MINDHVDLWLRLDWTPKTDRRSLIVVKCRPQRSFKPLLTGSVPIPTEESHLMYARLMQSIGDLPAVATAAADSAQEDAASQAAMRAASQPLSQ